MNVHLPPTVRPELPTDAAALLRLPGPHFVEAVYSALLGREPDPDGRVFFRRRLLDGITKLQIIGEFAASSEAKARPVTLPGLDELLKQTSPVVAGWRFRLQQALGQVHDCQATSRRDAVLQATLDELTEAAERSAAAQQQQIEALREQLDGLVDAQAAAIEGLERASAIVSGDLRAVAATLQRLQSDVDRVASLALPPRGSARTATSTPLERLAIARRAVV